MKLCIHVRPRDDGQGWAIDVYDGRRAWVKTHIGESPLNKAEAHRVAHKLRDPKFYSARTKRAVNSGAREGMGESRVGTMPGSGIPLPHSPFGMSDGEAREAARVRAESFCACGRRLPECDGSRAGCLGSTGGPGVRDTKAPCDMFSPGKPTEFFEGEWHFPKADGPEPWAVITYTEEPSPETGHVGWCWWAMGSMGDAPSYEAARDAAVAEIQRRMDRRMAVL